MDSEIHLFKLVDNDRSSVAKQMKDLKKKSCDLEEKNEHTKSL